MGGVIALVDLGTCLAVALKRSARRTKPVWAGL